jgi:ADP-ribose pyrophosphatase YjhB (NUDIX family)
MTDVTTTGGRWTVHWLPQSVAPPGTNHGSSGICRTSSGVVLVSRDGANWEFPAGRPEAGESLLETLHREVREEACCEVESAELLGFTASRCLEGPEEGRTLVRAHWAVCATAGSWRPVHEIAHRREVPVAIVMSVLTIEPGLGPVYAQIWERARRVFGGTDGRA